MKSSSLALILVLAGCAPAPLAAPAAVHAESAQSPADAPSCLRAGGSLQPAGKLQRLQCVIAYSDAGKSCASGDQCMGNCEAKAGLDVPAGQPVAGQCQATSNRFGCSTQVENGRALSTICVD